MDSCGQCVCGDIEPSPTPEYGSENTFWLERAPLTECNQRPTDQLINNECWRVMYHVTEPVYDLAFDLRNVFNANMNLATPGTTGWQWSDIGESESSFDYKSIFRLNMLWYVDMLVIIVNVSDGL